LSDKPSSIRNSAIIFRFLNGRGDFMNRRTASIAAILSCLATCSSLAAPPAKTNQYLQLRVIPASISLDNARDVRKVIVSGRTADGFWVDLTDAATFKPQTPLISRDKEGYVHPVKAGKTSLGISVAGKSVSVPVVVKGVANPPISFVRDVMPVMAKTGCNAGLCHGAAKGKNGFKLSLRGYDPEYDYHALIDDISGRRFNRAQPKESLMLLKPTQGAAHQGGLVFEENSRYYSLFYKWIAEGVKSDTATAKRANRIEVLPDAPKISLPGETQQLIVLAHYPDGSTRDVTREAVFTSTMPETATITPDGKVTAVRRGEVSVLVRYEGNYAADGMTVIGDRTGYKWVGQPQLNYIDKLVDDKLQRIKAIPSGLCTDADFIRRVYLDVIGVPPTADVVRAFLTDKTPTQRKRSALIDQLLESPDYVENWTNKWSDLLSVNRKYLGEKGTWKFRNWIRTEIADNRPYNEFVRDIITASGSSYEHPAAAYWRVARDTNIATENVTQLFLGIRFSCNKCHDHPFERWTQSQYYEFAANFARIGYKQGYAEGDEDVYERPVGEVTHLRTGKVMTAGFPYDFNGRRTKGDNRREALAGWLTSASNPLFAKSYTNRIWSYFLGKGIIDPVDDIRSSNPAVNPELLDALTRDFVKSNFDAKHLIRTICNSRTYQSSIKTNVWNVDDKTNFSHASPRRLTAEQLVDSLSRATGSIQRYPGVPIGYRAVQLPDSTVAAGGFLDLFGRPPRESPCECERSSTVSLGQTLNLVNGPTIADAIADPNGHIQQIMKSNPDGKTIVEAMFLSTLCRMPTDKELKKTLPMFEPSAAAIQTAKSQIADKTKVPSDAEIAKTLKSQAAQDLLWALINSPAFLFNR
jgi:hypothetical protein